MHKLNDGIHHCDTCDIYPCTSQPEVVSPICAKCPLGCCHHQLITLMPCEEDHYEKGWTGGLKCEDGNCHYLTPTGCSVFETRPIVCRIASCGFVRRGYIPEFVTKALNTNKTIV
jgi:hypothetical protein